MIKIIFATVAIAVFLALPATAETSLIGTNWRFIEVAGSTVKVDIRTLIRFDNGGIVSGSSGCNRFKGNYASGGSVLSFSKLGWTKMECSAPKMNIEQAIQSALAETRSFKIVEGKLQLLGSDGAALARLKLLPPK